MNARGHYGPPRVGEGAPQPRFAAMRRAVRAIFHLHDRAHAPFYVYTEVNGIADASPAQSIDEAYARAAAADRAPGEVYTAVFDVADMAWPSPAHQTYRAALPDRPSTPTTAGADAARAVEKGADAIATGVGDVWTMLKYGAWAALGIGAVITLSSVVQDLRTGRDPAEKYVALIRQRRSLATTEGS